MHSTRPQRPVADDTRRRLLDSGRRAFSAAGFANANTQTIVQEARVAQTALYHHFGSKLGLFVAVGREVYDTFVDYLDTRSREADGFDDCLQKLVSAATSLHRQDPTLAPMAITVQLEIRRDPEIRAELTGSLEKFQLLAGRIAARAPADLADKHGSRSMTLAVIALLNGLSTLSATLHDPEEFGGAAAALASIIRGPSS